MTSLDFISQIKKQLPDITVHQNHSLAPYTTFNIGGPAEFFIHSKTPHQFLLILKLIHQTRTERKFAFPTTLLGHGSNLLISDSGLSGLVIRNNLDSKFQIPDSNGPFPSGLDLQNLIKKTLNNNLVGLEQFAYIPASLGGAIVSNIHGADKSNFNQFLDTIQVFDLKTGQQKTLKASDLDWDYDKSEFQTKPNLIILSASLKLKKGDGKKALTTYQTIFDTKKQSQPFPSAGCIFKNLPAKALATAGLSTTSTGYLIDKLLHLKGFSIGDAKISNKHANFIVNTGKATSQDVYQLIKHIQQLAKQKLNINLKPEIKFLGSF